MIFIIAVVLILFLGCVIGVVVFEKSWVRVVMLLLFGLIAFLVLSPAITSHHHKSRRGRCMNNLSQISKACIMYSIDHKEQLPSSFLDLKDYANNPFIFARSLETLPALWKRLMSGLITYWSRILPPLILLNSFWLIADLRTTMTKDASCRT